jgi:CheY-like chemotaxis protein/anti-sigma regulatory factor (Ser/Thr protein kinase)
MGERAAARNLALFCEVSLEAPRWVRLDATKLRQVLINLVANAIQYTDAGRVTLRLGAAAARGPGLLRLRFDVEDTGIGIPAEDRDRMFEPFVQGGMPAARKGTGLGLTITRRFVDGMGGRIGMTGLAGQGTRVTVELPADVVAGLQSGGEASAEPVFFLLPGSPDYRVLVTGGDPSCALPLEPLLRRAGFHVRSAGDAEGALQAIAKWSPQFIWIDLRRPGLDGAEAARRMRELEEGRETPIAAIAPVSASGVASSAAIDEVISSPCRGEDILACMAGALGIRYWRMQTAAPTGAGHLRPLDRADVAALSNDLRHQLASALVSLDREQILSAADAIGQSSPELASVLTGLTERFSLTVILDWLENAQSDFAGAWPDKSGVTTA